jgi:hypothetical protein
MNRCFATIAALLLGGCATITLDRQEPIDIRTDPPGAQATVRCNGFSSPPSPTPAVIRIPRSATGCSIHAEQSGFESQQLPLKRGVSGKFWGAFWLSTPALSVIASDPRSADPILIPLFAAGLFGIVSMITDASTGHMWAHEPDDPIIKLVPQQR